MEDDKKNVSRRRALQILGLGGAVAATIALPGRWTRPIVESIVVPAHAQASQKAATTTDGGGSDIRIKHDIEPVGELANGLTLYRFRYKWSDTVYVGVMAQEVLEVDPGAVITGEDGFFRVNYRRLGIKMMEWDEWVMARAARVGAANSSSEQFWATTG
jgi:hypothetical protein